MTSSALPEERQGRAPTLTQRLQQKCSDWGTYWRAPDAHGVVLTLDQALELLRDALGVEVEFKNAPEALAVLVRGNGGAFRVRANTDALLAIYAMPEGEHSLYAGCGEAFPAARRQSSSAPPPAPAKQETMEEKNARNARVQARYDQLMIEGKHGHYETIFRVVREEVEAARSVPPSPAPGYVMTDEHRRMLGGGLVEALQHQRQIDEDGTFVGVSREAVHYAVQILSALAAAPSSAISSAAPDAPTEQEWVAQVVSSGPAANLPLLEWRSADVSLSTPIGTKLYAAPDAGNAGVEPTAAPTEKRELAATVHVGIDKLELVWHMQLPDGITQLYRVTDGVRETSDEAQQAVTKE
jgi:hypothetical protein